MSPGLNPECPRVNATNLDPDLDQNYSVSRAFETESFVPSWRKWLSLEIKK